MSPVHLTLINNIGYVFDANGKYAYMNCKQTTIEFNFIILDYMKLRCEHQIVGKLIGSSVKWPRNTSLAGSLMTIITETSEQLRA